MHPLGRPSKTTYRILSVKGVPPYPLTENHFAKNPLGEIGGGGYTPPPLMDNHCAQKSLAERGGTPSPLNRKNPLSSF